MKIYTKRGDLGMTSLFGGKQLPKNDLRIEAYGTVDELNSVLGVVLAHSPQQRTVEILNTCQHVLFELGADLATERVAVNTSAIRRITGTDVQPLEQFIDELEAQLVPLTNFILPGGASTAAFLHLARTVCRRAERCCVALAAQEDIGTQIVVYLNRLSDLLFVLARYENMKNKVEEIKWERGA